MEEIEAIETGKTTAPKAKKSAAKKTDKADPAPATDSKADKSTGKKIGTGSKATQGKANTAAPEQGKSEQPAA